MMTSATKVFYIRFFPFFCTNHTTSGGKYICIRWFKFVFVGLNLCMMILMQSWSLLIFPIFVAVGN